MFNHLFDTFSLFNMAYFFVIYAFIGWILETVSASWEERRFINRGFLNGPFCPIYGFGALLLLLVLHPVMNNICLLFSGRDHSCFVIGIPDGLDTGKNL